MRARTAGWLAAWICGAAVGPFASAQSTGNATGNATANTAGGAAPGAPHGAAGREAPLRPPVVPVPSPITDHFAFRGSFFDPKVTTDLRLDPAHGAGLGTPFNAEQELGLASKPYQGTVEFYFRLEDRSRVRFDYYQLNRTAQKALGETLVFGNNVFLKGTPVATAFNWQMFSLTYTYSFLRTDRVELGAGVGLTAIQAQVMGAEPLAPLRSDETGVGAVPTLAVDGIWRITRRFAASLRGQYFGASISHVKGSFGDFHGDLQFRALPNLALGLGYTDFDATLQNESGGDSLLGRFDFKVAGPEAFVRVSF